MNFFHITMFSFNFLKKLNLQLSFLKNFLFFYFFETLEKKTKKRWDLRFSFFQLL